MSIAESYTQKKPLRVCIDARIESGTSGGVESVIIGIAAGLSALEGDEEYVFLTHAKMGEWLKPYVKRPHRILVGASPPPQPRWKRMMARSLPGARLLWQQLSPLFGERVAGLPVSDGVIEQAGIDVMHFTLQSAFVTNVPSIYHPWDLQHLHLPGFFTPQQRLVREVQYRGFCSQARIVSVASLWSKTDLIRHYGLPERKIAIVPLAPVLSAYPVPTENNLEATREKYGLPNEFILYPAQTWPHKNHIGLLEALALIRDKYGLVPPLVSSGRRTSHFAKIQQRARDLRLEQYVKFLGFVTPLELQCLYRLCRCVIFPTQFEGWGMPLTEAFLARVPVACARVTSLPDLAGDAALLFDPGKPLEIADATFDLWTDQNLRDTLVARGEKNVARFSWERTAKLFRAHYRQIAGRTLTEEDRRLLEAPPIV